MAKNRNHYFKVKPGDEERMLRGVDVQAVGLLHRLRIVSFDCDPAGFIVDHKRRPMDLSGLADTFGMSNGRFKAIFTELRERQLIQSAEEYKNAIMSVSGGWVRLKVDVLHEYLRAFDVPLSEIFLVPTLVDDCLDTIVGQRTQRLRKQRGDEQDPPFMPPMHASHVSPASVPGPHAQISEVIGQRSEIQRPKSTSAFSERERFLSSRARDEAGAEKPMPWQVYTARAHEIQVWLKRQPVRQSEQAFAAAFEAEFQMTWSSWNEIKRRMELSIPQPCQDGHHVFGDSGGNCQYCPHTCIGEEAV